MKRPSPDILLIGCVSGKRNQKSQAKDIYDSPLWNYRRRYVELSACTWYVLSAEHELLHPDTVIEPYNRALSEQPSAERYEWSQRVLSQLRKEVPELKGKTFEIHAGKEYIEYGLEEGLCRAGVNVSRPLKGLGIGKQFKWYREYLDSYSLP